jgi:hypothetical protein
MDGGQGGSKKYIQGLRRPLRSPSEGKTQFIFAAQQLTLEESSVLNFVCYPYRTR